LNGIFGWYYDVKNESENGDVAFGCGIVKSMWLYMIAKKVTIKLRRDTKGG